MPASFQNAINCTTCIIPVALPAQPTNTDCACTLWSEGINDIYLIDCDAINPATIAADIIDTAWWTTLVSGSNLYKLGVGTAAIQVKNQITRSLPDGCGGVVDVRTNTEWQLTYEKFCIDKTATMATHEESIAIIGGILKRYNVVVRYCEGEFVGFIGAVTLGSFDAPHNGEGLRFVYEFNWKSKFPVYPVNVTGLNAIVAKAKAVY